MALYYIVDDANVLTLSNTQYVGYNTYPDTTGKLTRNKIVKIIVKQGETLILPEDCSNLFGSYINCTEMDVSMFDTSNVTNFNNCFKNIGSNTTSGCSIDVSNFNTSKVTNMSNMFSSSKFITLDFTNWDISAVTDLSHFLEESSSISVIFGNWDTSNVTDFSYFATYSENVIDINDLLSKFDFSAATTTSSMFQASKTKGSTDFSFTLKNLGKNVTSVDIGYMFYGSNATSINFGSTDLSKCSNISGMLGSNSNLTTVDLSGVSFGSSFAGYNYGIFAESSKLTTIKVNNTQSNWSSFMSNSGGDMFLNCTSLPNYDSSKVDITMAKPSTNGGYFTVESTKYTITVTCGDNGTISPAGPSVEIESGASQTFTITPNSGYKINGVMVDGLSVGEVTTYTFSNVEANHTISAAFVAIPSHNIMVMAGEHGSTNPASNPEEPYSCIEGGTFTITAIPDTGYEIDSIYVDTEEPLAEIVNPYIFTNVTDDHEYVVLFKEKQSTGCYYKAIGETIHFRGDAAEGYTQLVDGGMVSVDDPGSILYIVCDNDVKFNSNCAAMLAGGFAKLQTIDFTKVDTSEVTQTVAMFKECQNLQQIKIGDGWDMSHVESSSGAAMFVDCYCLPNFDETKIGVEMAKPTYEGGYLTKDQTPTVKPTILTFSGGSGEQTILALNGQVINFKNK